MRFHSKGLVGTVLRCHAVLLVFIMERSSTTRLTYNCAHLRSTKESDSVKKIFVRKSFCVKILLGENLLGEHFLRKHFFWGEIFWVKIF